MSVAYETIGTAGKVTGSSDRSVSLSLPGSTAEGDLLVAIVASSKTVTAPTGWTTVIDSATSTGFSAFSKTAGSSESGPYEFTVSSDYSGMHGVILRLSGASGCDTTAYLESADNDAELDLPAITIGNDGSLVLWCGTYGSLYVRTADAITRGSATERYDDASTDYYPLFIYTEPVDAVAISAGDYITLSSARSGKHGYAIEIEPAGDPTDDTYTIGTITPTGVINDQWVI
jgi:hypothetical protein